MRRAGAPLAAVALGAALLAGPAPAVGHVCAKSGKLRFHRTPGKHVGRLSWKSGGHGPYRVYRGRAVVGQTARHSIRVAVRPGHRYVFVVRPMLAASRVSSCRLRLKRKVRYYPPFRPRALAARNVTDTSAVLEWIAGRRGDGRLAGYRVYRDGKVYRQVHRRKLRIRLSAARTYRIAVAAADTRGHVSRRSRSITVKTGHAGPGAPGDVRLLSLTNTEAGLGWSPSRPRSARIVGYRIYRDGVVLAQVGGLSANARNLAPATSYNFTVAAVDSLGYVGDPSGPVAARTAMPPPTEGSMHAFLLATTDESFRDLQRHYRQVGTLYPTYFWCSWVDASIRGRDDPLVTRWAQLRQIAVMPRFDCQRADILHAMLTDPATRTRTVNALVSLVQQEGYQGINLDFESGLASDRDALTGFVGQVASSLHAIGRKVSVEASAKYAGFETTRSAFYDYAGLSASADTVFVMNWGWHWLTSVPGASDDLSRATLVADYVATMPHRKRFVLGTSLFGIDWPNGGGSAHPGTPLEYEDIAATLAATGATPVYDPLQDGWHFSYTSQGVPHEVWYSDWRTIAKRVRLARSHGLGLGLWKLGREDQRAWADPAIAPGAPWP